MTYNIFKVRNKNGNLRLRYSGGVLHEKGCLNGRSLPTPLVRVRQNTNHNVANTQFPHVLYFNLSITLVYSICIRYVSSIYITRA
jgi:hypothetical protein